MAKKFMVLIFLSCLCGLCAADDASGLGYSRISETRVLNVAWNPVSVESYKFGFQNSSGVVLENNVVLVPELNSEDELVGSVDIKVYWEILLSRNLSFILSLDGPLRSADSTLNWIVSNKENNEKLLDSSDTTKRNYTIFATMNSSYADSEIGNLDLTIETYDASAVSAGSFTGELTLFIDVAD